MISLLVADDHPIVRAGLRYIVAEESDISIRSEAVNGHQAVEKVHDPDVNVLILDITMPGPGFLETMRLVRESRPDLPVLVMSVHPEEHYAVRSLRAGAAGYLTKQEPLDLILEAIRGVARGETGWLSRRIAALFIDRHRARSRQDKELLSDLSEREREVLHLLALGKTNDEIGAQLFISESTVKKHVNSIYDKIEVNTRAQAVAWTWKNGLVDLENNGDING